MQSVAQRCEVTGKDAEWLALHAKCREKMQSRAHNMQSHSTHIQSHFPSTFPIGITTLTQDFYPVRSPATPSPFYSSFKTTK